MPLEMRLSGPETQPLCDEFDVLNEVLPFEGAEVLELGCGAADKTRQIAERTGVARIVAAEVDAIQHEKNLAIDDLPKVTFKPFGAEAIDEPDASFDIVLMFKSLHHVPLDVMDAALKEIHRVLRPGGVAYISEPVFEGSFNEVIRLFHDEQSVRLAAFEAVERSVAAELFDLGEERFFRNRVRLQSFEQFEKGIIQSTHTEHRLDDALLAQVRERFESNASDAGYVFDVPNRVDILVKGAA